MVLRRLKSPNTTCAERIEFLTAVLVPRESVVILGLGKTLIAVISKTKDIVFI